MKKVTVVLVLLLGIATSLLAQQGGNMDPARMRERQLKMLKESDLRLTDEQANSVVSINMEAREQMRNLRDMTDEDRRRKMTELNGFRKKRWAQALKDEALANKVAEYYEKQRGNRMNMSGGQQ